MDEDMSLDGPEDQTTGEVEAEVPEDEEVLEDADSDEAEDSDDEDGGEQEQGEDQSQPKSRANNRIRALSSEKKAERERADKAEAEITALRHQMETVQRSLQAGTAAKNSQAEAELLEQMDPVQRVQYDMDKKINNLHAQVQRAEFSAADSRDKAEFLSKYQSEPALARLSSEVEKTLSDMRSKGFNAPREELFALAIGRDLLAKKSQTGKKNPDKQAAQARVNSTQGRSSSARSDTSSGRKGKSAEERLENIIL
jgi:hypothetical protein